MVQMLMAAPRLSTGIHGMVNDWIRSVQSWLSPPTCVLCDQGGADGRDLCHGCAGELPYVMAACRRCAIPLPQPGVCGQCQQRPPAFDAAQALFHYREPVDQLITGLKFNGRLQHARLLGELMADAFLDRHICAEGGAILPVPLHPARLRERGFNQALELARPIARHLGLPLLPRLCQRQHDTAPQLGQDAAARRRNLKGAFVVSDPGAIKSVVVVDDVMTTGSTVELMAQALKRAGVERVEVWVCARADLSGGSR